MNPDKILTREEFFLNWLHFELEMLEAGLLTIGTVVDDLDRINHIADDGLVQVLRMKDRLGNYLRFRKTPLAHYEEVSEPLV